MLLRLMVAADELAASMSALFKEDVPLTEVEGSILALLGEEDGLSVPTIARRRGVSRQSVQTVIDRLVASEWAARAPNPAHRRSWLYTATDTGRALTNQSLAAKRRRLESLQIGVSDESLAAAVRTLSAVRSAIERELSHKITP